MRTSFDSESLFTLQLKKAAEDEFDGISMLYRLFNRFEMVENLSNYKFDWNCLVKTVSSLGDLTAGNAIYKIQNVIYDYALREIKNSHDIFNYFKIICAGETISIAFYLHYMFAFAHGRIPGNNADVTMGIFSDDQFLLIEDILFDKVKEKIYADELWKIRNADLIMTFLVNYKTEKLVQRFIRINILIDFDAVCKFLYFLFHEKYGGTLEISPRSYQYYFSDSPHSIPLLKECLIKPINLPEEMHDVVKYYAQQAIEALKTN